MKKINTLTVILLVVLLILNILSLLNIHQKFISFLNSSLEQNTNMCGTYVDKHLSTFENDLNKLLYDYNFSLIFKDGDEFESTKQRLQVFYSKYNELVTNIFVFDNEKNYFGLYINDGDEFLVDTFPRQRQQQLIPRVNVEEINGKYLYHYPYFEKDKVRGNIIVEIDFDKFTKRMFSFYPLGKTITRQWVINSDGEILTKDFADEFKVGSSQAIADSIELYSHGSISHNMTDSEGKIEKVQSAYFPIGIFDKNLGIVFTSSQSDFNRFFILQNMFVTIIAIIITLVLILYLLKVINMRTKSQERLKMSEIVFRQIIEKFPLGIMILDSGKVIRNINSAAQRMMFAEKQGNLVGKEYSKQFLISNNYLLKDSVDSLDTSDYLYYEKEGIETVIYRMEETTRIGGEELTLVALIDVSAIERSRKQEVAANKAKSDFLASMSHEIRTPMNGILGMVSSLLDKEMTGETEQKVKIIKKSTDLLMTIINDILDFSKIEAGKMMLEEIPFRLREEISMVMELFRPLAGEKRLQLNSDIKTSVPDMLIGDPFRLRQVISNLVSNAIKFTEKGRIEIQAELMENFNGRIHLLFRVEDTGIGIPADKIDTIFGSYAQSRKSVSRKFGGTGLGTAISRQLVELMNGEIWVESPSRISTGTDSPGSGFSFTIEVFSNEKIEKQYNFESIQQLNQVTVLFLSKESTPEKDSISKLLIKFGVNVVTKIYQNSTMDAVLHHLAVKKDVYNMVVISDKQNQDGFVIAGKLKEEGLIDKIPAVVVSSNDTPGNYKVSRRLGIDYYLIEPFESKEVYDIIREVFPGIKDLGSITDTLNTLPSDLSILVVEDNLINQKVAQSIFKNIGYEIDLASNGAEAIKMVDANNYDIIFMDLHMPEVDGYEAAEYIRKKGLKTPIIAMSADSEDQRKAESVKAGMDEYLAKPARVETIKQLLIKMFSVSVN
ncbi:MAG: response regulator [Bacteroidales bacterium]